MKAGHARHIRRRSQRRSACRDHMGVSELFTAPSADRDVMLGVSDPRCLMWLLGFSDVPAVEDGGDGAEVSDLVATG
ncbi:MAG: hypothetical protein ACF8LK_00125 [Phycisphaerales bacterium JB041]